MTNLLSRDDLNARSILEVRKLVSQGFHLSPDAQTCLDRASYRVDKAANMYGKIAIQHILALPEVNIPQRIEKALENTFRELFLPLRTGLEAELLMFFPSEGLSSLEQDEIRFQLTENDPKTREIIFDDFAEALRLFEGMLREQKYDLLEKVSEHLKTISLPFSSILSSEPDLLDFRKK